MWKKNTRERSLIRTVGMGIAFAVSVSAAAYYLWKSSSEDDTNSMQPKAKKQSKSKCIIITESIAEIRGIDWVSCLNEDIVLLVAPCVSFTILEKEYKNNPTINYKVINCDTVTGVWACVKSLKKDEVIAISNEIKGGIPEDIGRYSIITNINTKEDFLNIFPLSQ